MTTSATEIVRTLSLQACLFEIRRVNARTQRHTPLFGKVGASGSIVTSRVVARALDTEHTVLCTHCHGRETYSSWPAPLSTTQRKRERTSASASAAAVG